MYREATGGFEPSSRLLIECRRLSDPRYPRKLILLAQIARLFLGLFLRFLNPASLRGLHNRVSAAPKPEPRNVVRQLGGG